MHQEDRKHGRIVTKSGTGWHREAESRSSPCGTNALKASAARLSEAHRLISMADRTPKSLLSLSQTPLLCPRVDFWERQMRPELFFLQGIKNQSDLFTS